MDFIKNLPSNIKNSFILTKSGKEDVEIVIWLWGGIAYLLATFFSKLILWNKYFIIDCLISLLVIAYFFCHIIALRRCAPKKPTLTKEEKEILKKERTKRFLRKLFLQEPISKWDPVMVAIVIDLFVIVTFLEYIIR